MKKEGWRQGRYRKGWMGYIIYAAGKLELGDLVLGVKVTTQNLFL
jgi:hypothetical protein